MEKEYSVIGEALRVAAAVKLRHCGPGRRRWLSQLAEAVRARGVGGSCAIAVMARQGRDKLLHKNY